MAVDSTSLKLNTSTEYKKPEEGLVMSNTADDNYLLSITSRFKMSLDNALMNVEKVMTSDDVLSGSVEKEIDKILSEEDQITAVLKANTNSLNSITANALESTVRSTAAKTIGFVEYTSKSKVNSKTDTTAIKANCAYANAEQQKVVEGAIDVLTNWLDDYIANYNVRVAEGLKRGDSELKLSFLLEIRKAIENVDFPVGFGDYSAPGDENTLGSYQLITGGYDSFKHLNTGRSILLNAKYLMPERKYTSTAQVQDDINAGQREFAYIDLALATDEGYYNYCQNYMASVLVHELVHSTHIYNEAVTYFTNDSFDDDFYNQELPGQDTKFMQDNFGATLTYGMLGISHELNGFNDAVEHGHKMNTNYDGLYNNMGLTKNDDKKELLNFAVTA